MEKQQLKQTKYDSLVTNRTMQLVKAVIPYINNDAGTLIGMLIKFQELQNAARINNNVAIAAMNADIKDFLDDDNREMLENIMSIMEMMSMDENAMNDFMGSFMGGDFNQTNNN